MSAVGTAGLMHLRRAPRASKRFEHGYRVPRLGLPPVELPRFHRRELTNLRPVRLQPSLAEANLADLADLVDLHMALHKSTAMCLFTPSLYAKCVRERACDL